MKRNPVIPYALIALLGILAVIVISVVGIGQRDDIQQAAEGGGEKAEESQEGETTDDPEAVYETNCSSCHGGDLSGGMGPDLTQVGSKLSKDEIQNIIINGQGQMPAGMASEAEAQVLAEWLAEKQ
ncbi:MULTISPECIES: cytochrome c550 [Virgibacillus]|uniref:Cytochrome C n=1 Tax=Virgibacillus pantothenticus TaxID=1473 RepID=A0A0L0QPJ0_VIRPA|nr:MULTISPECIES: cytochrome c [Virgibacillus]API90559.1 cytochrome C [Virgibacillus sp. 6R]KNE20515.1 cytochrome C [Virgibacillus pantothenticus]MBS7429671.1 cytochrome c [Virgibacillus sp. 19R1-5]MBU8565546.1 cytochrome c [Virgibacillus pantothenticus]MBU8599845.1 cytochrome c [Virgibacillus pantothenticus]